jgi:hypothetical protein
MYFPIIMAPPFGDARCRPDGTGGLILKAVVKWVRDEVDTFLDDSVQVWKQHRPRVCYLIDALEFPPHLITQLGKCPSILEEKIRRIRKGRRSRIRRSSTASTRSGELRSTVESAHLIEVLRNRKSCL